MQVARRAFWAAIAAAATAVLIAARTLTPSPSGVGTHRALGLPPCAFHAWSGVPCPTCGLTTSFALAARGQLDAALHAHPLGPPLLALTALAVPYALVSLLRASCPLAAVDRLRADRAALVLVLGLGAVWVVRVARVLGP